MTQRYRAPERALFLNRALNHVQQRHLAFLLMCYLSVDF
jgi:hypothetical protein